MKIDHKQVTIDQYLEHLEMNIILDVPTFAWSAPGIGKTKATEDFIKSKGWKFIDFMLPLMDSVDLAGVPYTEKVHSYSNGVQTGELVTRSNFAPPVSIPLEGDYIEEDYCIVFLDELPNAQPMTVSASFKMVDERVLGNNKIHPKVRFVAAGNPVSTSRAANIVPQPLLNRMKHYQITASAKQWCGWGANNGIHPAWISFIEINKDSLHYENLNIEAQKAAFEEKAFNTPRTIEMASDALYQCEAMNKSIGFILTEMAATIGSSLAGVFMEFYKNNSVVPNPNDILKGKAEVRTDLDRGQTYFMINSVLATINGYVKDCVKSDLDYAKQPEYLSMVDNMVDYMDKVLTAEDISVLAMRFFTKPFSFRVPGKCNSKIYAWWELPEVKEYYGVLG